MRLTRIEIGHLPGIMPGNRWIVDGFDPHVTVLVGRNASGKSSLVRALHALLQPDRLRDPMVDVAAEFREGDVVWRGHRLGANVAWTRDGQPSEPPVVPSEAHLQGVTLRIEDLMATHGGDAEIAHRIARELSGGYDLQGVRERVPFQVGPRHARTSSRALREAEKHAAAVRRDAQRMAEKEKQRDAWIVELKDAQRDVRRIEPLRAAQRLLDARMRLREADAALDTMPRGMDGLTDGVIEDRARYRQRREALLDREREIEVARKAAGIALHASGLADRPVDVEDVAVIEASIGELSSMEDVLRRAEADVAATHAVMAQAVDALGGVPDVVPDVTPDALQHVEDLLDVARSNHGRREALEARLNGLAASLDRVGVARDVPASDVQRHADRLRALRVDAVRMLRVRPAGATTRWPGWLALVLGSGAIAIAVTQGAWFAAGIAGLLVVLGVAWARTMPGSAVAASSGSGALTEAATMAGIEPPSAWDDATLQGWLEDLDDRVVQWTTAHRDALERDQRLRDLDVVLTALGDVEVRRDALASRLGVDSPTFDLPYARWLQRIHAWDEARSRNAVAVASRDGTLRTMQALQARIADALTPLETSGEWSASTGGARDVRAVQWRARLDALRKRLDARDDALRSLRDADVQRERVTRERDELEAEEAAWRDRLHLEADEDADVAFQRRLDARDRWRAWRDLRATAMADERSALERLGDAPDVLALAEAGELVAIEEDLERIEALQEVIEQRTTDIARVNAEVDAATKADTFAAASDRVRRAVGTLREARAEATFAAAAQFLFDEVTEAFEATTRPAMLKEAETTFAAFTRHAYALSFERSSGGSPSFAAREADGGVVRRFEELSTGTRMQAFIAVRMAFARAMERGGPALPLILDEALTTSDPERFGAVVTALARVVRDDARQVIYLSARREDAVAWRSAMEVADEVPVGCTVLEIERHHRAQQVPLDEVAAVPAEPPDVPVPDGQTPEAYGALIGATTVDPWMDPASIHVFHVLRDDLHLLRRLLSIGVSRLGSLETWLPTEGVQALIGSDAAKRLAGRVAASRVWISAWREGRARPIDARVLEASGAVSEAYLAELAAIAAEARGDARAVLDAIDGKQVKRFHTAKREELAAYLEAEGYLVDVDPLPAPVRVARMASELERRGFAFEAADLTHLDAALDAGAAHLTLGAA